MLRMKDRKKKIRAGFEPGSPNLNFTALTTGQSCAYEKRGLKIALLANVNSWFTCMNLKRAHWPPSILLV